jgi:hypothetical protein
VLPLSLRSSEKRNIRHRLGESSWVCRAPSKIYHGRVRDRETEWETICLEVINSQKWISHDLITKIMSDLNKHCNHPYFFFFSQFPWVLWLRRWQRPSFNHHRRSGDPKQSEKLIDDIFSGCVLGMKCFHHHGRFHFEWSIGNEASRLERFGINGETEIRSSNNKGMIHSYEISADLEGPKQKPEEKSDRLCSSWQSKKKKMPIADQCLIRRK